MDLVAGVEMVCAFFVIQSIVGFFCFSAELPCAPFVHLRNKSSDVLLHYSQLHFASPDQRAGAGADSFPPAGLWCRCVTMATFVRLQIQLLCKSPSALVAGVEGEVLGDSDLGAPRGAVVVLAVLAACVSLGAGGGRGGALVRVSGDRGADGTWLIFACGGSGD